MGFSKKTQRRIKWINRFFIATYAVVLTCIFAFGFGLIYDIGSSDSEEFREEAVIE